MHPLRRKFIDQLKYNPDGRDQIEVMLTNGGNGRCALGLGLEGIGVDISGITETAENDAYVQGAQLMGFGENGWHPNYDMVWRLNDRGTMTFAEIAEELEKAWEE